MLMCDQHLYKSPPIEILGSLQIITLTESALLIFFAIRGWNIAGMGSRGLYPQPWIWVLGQVPRASQPWRPLSMGSEVFKDQRMTLSIVVIDQSLIKLILNLIIQMKAEKYFYYIYILPFLSKIEQWCFFMSKKSAHTRTFILWGRNPELTKNLFCFR